MTPNEEILQIIRYAPGPIGASAIYEKCKSIESISDVSSRLSQLFNQGKLKREEITTAANRKGFAYSIKKPGEAESAAPAAAAGAAAAPAAAKPAAAKTRGKAKDKDKATPKARPDPVAKGLDQVQAALKDSPAPAPPSVRPELVEGQSGTRPSLAETDPAILRAGADASRLADAILARLRRQLASAPAPESDAALPASMSIHIAHLEIHLGGL